jgi:anti-sigma-K factor RskA
VNESFDALDVALGEVAPEQRPAAEARLREDAAFAAEVERLRAVTGPLDALPPDVWTPPAPPPLRVLTAVAPPPAPQRRPRAITLRPLLAVAAAFALLAAGVAGTLAVQALERGGGDGVEVTLGGLPEAPDARATAVLRQDDGRVRLDVRGLPASSRDSFYELWLLNAPDDLVAVGTFRVGADGRAELDFPLAVDPRRFRVLDVSLEAVDGDPGHSARSVLRSPPLS